MSLIACPECGKEVSDSAALCPHCGFALKTSVPEKSETKQFGCGTLLIAIFVLLLVVGIFSQNETDPTPATQEPTETDAYYACAQFVRKRLRAPSTADFPRERSVKRDGKDFSIFHVAGMVDSQNSFGAKIRAPWTCSIRSSGDQWLLISADLIE